MHFKCWISNDFDVLYGKMKNLLKAKFKVWKHQYNTIQYNTVHFEIYEYQCKWFQCLIHLILYAHKKIALTLFWNTIFVFIRQLQLAHFSKYLNGFEFFKVINNQILLMALHLFNVKQLFWSRINQKKKKNQKKQNKPEKTIILSKQKCSKISTSFCELRFCWDIK